MLRQQPVASEFGDRPGVAEQLVKFIDNGQ